MDGNAPPIRLILIGLGIAFIVAGGAVLHIAIAHAPMEFYTETGFNYPYSIFLFVGAGLFHGPFVFLFGLMAYGLGYTLVFAFRLLFQVWPRS